MKAFILSLTVGITIGVAVSWISLIRTSSSPSPDPDSVSKIPATSAPSQKKEAPPNWPMPRSASDNFDRWNASDPNQRIAMVNDLAARLSTTDLQSLLNEIVEEAPGMALVLALQMPEGGTPRRLQGANAVAAAFDMDPEGTISWLLNLDSDTRAEVLSWGNVWKQGLSKSQTLQLAESFEPGKQRDAILESIITSLDLETGLSLLSEIDSDSIRSEALSDMATYLGRDYPNRAFALAGEISDPSAQNDAYGSLAWNSRDTDLGFAFECAFAISNLEDRRNSIRNLVMNWVENDPVAASRWLTDLPSGADRDSAIIGFVERYAEVGDPEEVVPWLNEIENESLRRRYSEGLGADWLKRDRKKAIQWLRSQSGLPPKRIEILIAL
ncbi:MAG: hypothetical protein AAF591_03915 [Verrucomicrobiota bacterium]